MRAPQRTHEIRDLQETVRSLQTKIKTANEDELPRLQDEVIHLQDKLRQLQSKMMLCRMNLPVCMRRRIRLVQRCDQLQSKVSQYSAEITERKVTVSGLHQAGKNCCVKLAEQRRACWTSRNAWMRPKRSPSTRRDSRRPWRKSSTRFEGIASGQHRTTSPIVITKSWQIRPLSPHGTSPSQSQLNTKSGTRSSTLDFKPRNTP